MVDIRNEARKHLLEFLIKILDDSYTLNEAENFIILKYQDMELEEVRQIASKALQPAHGSKILSKKPISSSNKAWLRGVIPDLKSICIYE